MSRKWRRRILGVAFGTFVTVMCTWSYGIYLTDRSLYKPCITDEDCRDKNNDRAVENEIKKFAVRSKIRLAESYSNAGENFQQENVLRTTYETTVITTTQNQNGDSATTQDQHKHDSTTQNQNVDSATTQDQHEHDSTTQNQNGDSATTQDRHEHDSTTQNQNADSATTQDKHEHDSTTQNQHVHSSTKRIQHAESSTLQHQHNNSSKTQQYHERSATLTPPRNQTKRKEVFYTPTVPKVLWWDFYGNHKNDSITCKGGVKCHSVSNKIFENHPDTMAIIHYGSNFNFMDLPKERLPGIIWGLIHEESLKNADYVFNHQEILSLFNYTATFKRNSDYPVTTQFVPNLEYLMSKINFVTLKDKNRYKKEEKLAPIFYIQSDCYTPSNREKYVELLQKYIKIDSYGVCNNNKELPEYLKFGKSMAPMNHKDFFKLGAKYKFTLAMENAVCDDYITEKLWRPFHLGSVPIVFGSPKIKDFLPSEKSAIVIDDFDDVKDLAVFVQYLDQNDTAYAEYLHFKEKGGITNKLLINDLNKREWSKYNDMKKPYWSYFSGFECFICEQIHRDINAVKSGKKIQRKIAPVDHYGCPPPKRFNDKGKYVIENSQRSYYWYEGKYRAKAFRYFYDQHLNYTEKSVEELAKSLRKEIDENR